MNSVAFAVILGLLSSPLPFQHQNARYVIVRDFEVNAVAVVEFKPDMTLTDALHEANDEEEKMERRFRDPTDAKILRDGETIRVRLKPEWKKAAADQFKVQPYDVIDLPRLMF